MSEQATLRETICALGIKEDSAELDAQTIEALTRFAFFMVEHDRVPDVFWVLTRALAYRVPRKQVIVQLVRLAASGVDELNPDSVATLRRTIRIAVLGEAMAAQPLASNNVH